MASGSQLDATLPETPPTSGQLSSTVRLADLHNRMKDEISQILDNEVKTQETLKELRNDLSVSKRAYSSLDGELVALRERSKALEKERDDLLNKLKANRLVVLIDGDGAIFDLDLIAQGQEGGHKAASLLAEGIMRHLPNHNNHQLWAYVFLNKRGLSDAFYRVAEQQARLKLDDFMIGFNQSTERFIMVDVGGAKEAADAKIKALFEAEVRLPQTGGIIFAGCHDNGYVTTLRSHITSGSRDKLVLLQSYDEVASGIEALNLPILSIPNLFIPHKLAPGATPQLLQRDIPTFPMSPKAPSGFASFETKVGRSRASSLAGSDPSVAESASRSGVSPSPSHPLLLPGSREPNRSVPIWHQNPRLCTLHHLSPGGCKFKQRCQYSHDYILTLQDLETLRAHMRKNVPCDALSRGHICEWGDQCPYGHKCPRLPNCAFFKQNKCKFKGKTMHTLGEELIDEDLDKDSKNAPSQSNEEVEVHANTAGPADAAPRQGDEDLVFKIRATLFRFDSASQKWKERGGGIVSFYRDTESKTVRLVMRLNKTFKVCANHFITSDLCLQPNAGSDQSWVWRVPADYSEYPPTSEGFAMRFSNPHDAGQFKIAFEEAKKNKA